MMSGSVYMIPVTLGDPDTGATIPVRVCDITRSLRLFAVEDLRSARRYLRLIDKSFPIDDSQFFSIGKHSSGEELEPFFNMVEKGMDGGVMSEAGMPGIADPGAMVALEAHRRGIKVIPLTGPSSIMLGLSASGLNGQSFAFNGYLPLSPAERSVAIKELERRSSGGQTQIFIETPFRNQKMFDDIISTCKPATMLCVACDITSQTEEIMTLTASDWKKKKISLAGRQVVFMISTRH